MKQTFFILVVALILAFVGGLVSADVIDHTNRILPATTPYHMGILHTFDPFTSSWSFYCNRPGAGPGTNDQLGIVVNMGSDIRIIGPKVYNDDSNFQVGIQGGETGKIIDLGTEDDVSKTYGCSNCFTGIKFSSDGVVSVLDKTKNLKPIDLTAMTVDHASIKVGHIYLVKISNGNDDTALFVKFIATSVLYGANNAVETVTMRHQPMYVKISQSTGRDCAGHVDLNSVVAQAETGISLAVIGLVATIFIGVGNVAFLIYYFAFAKGKRGGVYGTLQ